MPYCIEKPWRIVHKTVLVTYAIQSSKLSKNAKSNRYMPPSHNITDHCNYLAYKVIKWSILIPIILFLLLLVEEFYGTRYQSGSFSLVNVGSGIPCLRSFSFFLFLDRGKSEAGMAVRRHVALKLFHYCTKKRFAKSFGITSCTQV